MVFSDSDLGVFFVVFLSFCAFLASGVKTDMLVILSNPCLRLGKSGMEVLKEVKMFIN